MDKRSRDAEILAAMVGTEQPNLGPVVLVEPQAVWGADFVDEAARLRRALPADRIVALEHVGSTSVPGLPAKPTIDMLLVVANSSDEASYVTPLEAAGYVLRIREPEWHEHRLLVHPPDERRISLHVFSVGSSEVDRMVRFRDHLRANRADRELYASVKRDLASREWKYVQHYADAKSEVVEDILTRAGPGDRQPPL